jgi:glucosylceramidase
MALDTNGGPNWVNNFVDSPVIVNASAQEYYKQPMFYALGHFSKFLIPDSVRINLQTDINIENITTTAFLRPDNAIVIIVVNANDESVLLTIQLNDNQKVSKEVLPHSIQSYIAWNIIETVPNKVEL